MSCMSWSSGPPIRVDKLITPAKVNASRNANPGSTVEPAPDVAATGTQKACKTRVQRLVRSNPETRNGLESHLFSSCQ